jgi:hypothetical protein
MGTTLTDIYAPPSPRVKCRKASPCRPSSANGHLHPSARVQGRGIHAQDPFFIEGHEVTRGQRSVCSVSSASFLHYAYYILPTMAQKSLFESDGATVHLLSQRPALDERDSDDKVLFPKCSRWELLHRSIWCAALPHSLPLVRARKGQACPAKGVKYHWAWLDAMNS